MKKTILFLGILFFTTFTHAQIFIGGGLGFNTQSGSMTRADDNNSSKIEGPTITRFHIAPFVGYNLSEKLAIGLELGFNTNKTKSNQDPVDITSYTGWNVSPFARYYFLKFNKLLLYGQGNINAMGTNSKITKGNITAEQPTTFSFGLNLFPAVQYNLSNRISLFSELRIFNLNFTHSIYKRGTELGGSKTTDKYSGNSFNFGANSNDLFNSNNFQVGFHINL